MKKIKQNLYAIYQTLITYASKLRIASFVGGQFKKKREQNFIKLEINGQTIYCKKISKDKTFFYKFGELLTKTLKKMNISKKTRYYVEFQFCTRDCEIDYLFPNFFEVSDRKELISLIKQTWNSILEQFEFVSSSKPNQTIKHFNDTRYDDIYMTHVKMGKFKYL